MVISNLGDIILAKIADVRAGAILSIASFVRALLCCCVVLVKAEGNGCGSWRDKKRRSVEFRIPVPELILFTHGVLLFFTYRYEVVLGTTINYLY